MSGSLPEELSHQYRIIRGLPSDCQLFSKDIKLVLLTLKLKIGVSYKHTLFIAKKH